MKNLKIFDVVLLDNKLKGTILDIKNNTYIIEVVNNKGVSMGRKEISEDKVIEVIHSHK